MKDTFLFVQQIIQFFKKPPPPPPLCCLSVLQRGEAETGAGVPLHRGARRAAVVQHRGHRQSQRQAGQVPHPQEHRGPNPADEAARAG